MRISVTFSELGSGFGMSFSEILPDGSGPGFEENQPGLGTTRHSRLSERELPDQHPIEAISGLREELDDIAKSKLDQEDLQAATDDVLAQAKASGEFDGDDGEPGKDGADGADGQDAMMPISYINPRLSGGYPNYRYHYEIYTPWESLPDSFLFMPYLTYGMQSGDGWGMTIYTSKSSGWTATATNFDGWDVSAGRCLFAYSGGAVTAIRGETGKDGTAPHIGDNGNWWIGDEDTGQPSRGEPGENSVSSVPTATADTAGVVQLVDDCEPSNAFGYDAASGKAATPKAVWQARYDSSNSLGHHMADTDAHNDIRLLIDGLTTRLNTLANSTDEDLDQMAELVAYIKANKSLIDQITTSKVSVTDIVNNLTTNVTNKPLSAAQGVALKGLVDALQSRKLDASELTTAIDTALEQAKASGEFDGKPGIQGERGYSGVYLGSDTPPADANVWIDPSGDASIATEEWTFTLEDGSTVTKAVLVG